MRKKLIVFITCVALVQISCNKEEKIISQNTEESKTERTLNPTNPYAGYHQPFDNWYSNNHQRLDSVDWFELTSHQDKTLKRLIFSATSTTNKYLIVKEKFNQLLLNGTYSPAQYSFVDEVYDYLSIDLYSGLTQAKHIAVQDFKIDAMQLFSSDETFMLLADFNNYYEGAMGPSLDNCSCSTASDWCDFPADVGGCTGSCDVEGGGCGTLFLYTCNSDCELGSSTQNWNPSMW